MVLLPVVVFGDRAIQALAVSTKPECINKTKGRNRGPVSDKMCNGPE